MKNRVSSIKTILCYIEFVAFVSYMIIVAIIMLLQYENIVLSIFWILIASVFSYVFFRKIYENKSYSVIIPNPFIDVVMITALVNILFDKTSMSSIEICGILVCVIDISRWIISKYD